MAEEAACAALTHTDMRRIQVRLRSYASPAARNHACARLDHSRAPRIQVAVRVDASPVEAHRVPVRLNPATERGDTSPVRPHRCGSTTNQVPVTSEVFAAPNAVSSNADATEIQAEFIARARLNHPEGAADCEIWRGMMVSVGDTTGLAASCRLSRNTALSATMRLDHRTHRGPCSA